MNRSSKPRAGITENQDTYIRDELRITKAEAGKILGKEIERISDLTKAEAFRVIGETIDQTILKFHPGAKIEVDIKITNSDEGLPATFKGRAEVQHYQYQMTDQGLYLNVVMHIPSLNRTITRGISFFRQRAKVVEENPKGVDLAKQQLEKYHTLQHWHQVLLKRINTLWLEMLHKGELPRKALKAERITPGLKYKLLTHIMGELTKTVTPEEELTDEMIIEAIKAVAGYVLFD